MAQKLPAHDNVHNNLPEKSFTGTDTGRFSRFLNLAREELVANPESLRQAIILNEILHRPEERAGQRGGRRPRMRQIQPRGH